MNDQQWYYESNGEQAGPISWDALMVGIKMGKLTSETRVWASHLPEWTALGQCIQRGTQPAIPSTSSFSSVRPKKRLSALTVIMGIVLAGIIAAIIIPAAIAITSKSTSSMIFCEGVTDKLEPIKPSNTFTPGVITYVITGGKIRASSLSIVLYKVDTSSGAESVIDQTSITVNPDWKVFKNVLTLVEPGEYRIVLTRPDGTVFANGSVVIQ